MLAVRVPILGIAVAVALLFVENVGIAVYRDHVQAAPAAADTTDLDRRGTLRELAQRVERLEQLNRRIAELSNILVHTRCPHVREMARRELRELGRSD